MLLDLAVPWEDVLHAIEQSKAVTEVTIESIRPDPAARLVELNLSATDFSQIVAFVNRLEESGALERVMLQMEATDGVLQQNTASSEIRTTVTARWKRPGLE